jgi:Cof subfamily protein (haloacid dehalogenase superfamily)
MYIHYSLKRIKAELRILCKFQQIMTSSSHAYQLVITDIDGTLLDDEGNLPKINREALAHCRDLGLHTCLATGRRWTTCSRLLDRLDLHNLIDFCILNNGMLVREVKTGEILHRENFPISLLLEAVARLNILDLDPIMLGHNHDGFTKDVFHRRDALLNADFIAKNSQQAHQVSDWAELAKAHLVELVLIGKKSDLENAALALEPLNVETVILKNSIYAEYMLEVTPKGVSKLSGTRQLLSHLGFELHQAIAVGDSDNDFKLLEALPMSIAVANADEKVKAIAKELTGSNSEGGFGQAVFRHLPRSF